MMLIFNNRQHELVLVDIIPEMISVEVENEDSLELEKIK